MSIQMDQAEVPGTTWEDTLTDEDYKAQARFRQAFRSFLHVAELNARAAGITPQQHLLLLAVRGHEAYPRVTITDVAEQLQLRHNAASLLVERAVQRELLQRQEDPEDRRRALVTLTAKGTRILSEITHANRHELRALESTVARLLLLMNQMQAPRPDLRS